MKKLFYAAGADQCEIDWLSPGRALDILFSGLPKERGRELATNELSGFPADINVQSFKNRRKKVLIADMDSTIITCETLDELAELIGISREIKPITHLAMQGQISFKVALRDRVRLLAGQPASLLHQLLRERVFLTAGAKTLVHSMKHYGAFTALVSGGFSFFTEAIKNEVDFDFDQGNQLSIINGKISGHIAEPILDPEAKLNTLRDICKRFNISTKDAIAVGDGANDIPVLLEAGIGVAFRAKQTVNNVANYRVKYGDLTSLLYLQGYKECDFIC